MAGSPAYNSDEDIFADEDELSEKRKSGCFNDSARDEKAELENARVKKLVDNLKSLLTGVPPPPLITGLLSFSASHVLSLWYKNMERLQWSKPPSLGHEGKEEATQTESEKALKKEKLCINGEGGHLRLGINYNTCSACEELEIQTCRYLERYVGCETDAFTASRWCFSPRAGDPLIGEGLVRPSRSRPLTASAKKRAKLNGWAVSPGRRLSYLARRRTTFGVEQLRQQQQHNTNLLMVEVTARNKGTRTCGGRRPGSSKKSKHKSPGRGIKSCPKRALFQSPEEPAPPSSTCTPTDRPRSFARRALWPSGGDVQSEAESKVRHSVKRRKSSVSRSLSFSDHAPHTPATLQLSNTHKQKLLWAVSNALKCEGVQQSDPRFRSLGTALFKQCGRAWLYNGASSPWSSSSNQSTSEAMLEMAKAHLPGIMAEMEAVREQSRVESSDREVNIVSSLVTDKMLQQPPLASRESCSTEGSLQPESSGTVSNNTETATTTTTTTTAVDEANIRQSGMSGCEGLKRKREPDDIGDDPRSQVVPPERKNSLIKFCLIDEIPGNSESYTRVVLTDQTSSAGTMIGEQFLHQEAIRRNPKVVRVRRIGGDMVELYIPNTLLLENEASSTCSSQWDNMASDYVDIGLVSEKLDAITKSFEAAAASSKSLEAVTAASRHLSNVNVVTSKQSSSTFQLTEVHKKKLVWAASKAVQESNWSPRSRRCRYSSLLKKLRTVWTELQANGSNAPLLGPGGTSDRMLNLARSILIAQENGQAADDWFKVRLELRNKGLEDDAGTQEVQRRLGGTRLEMNFPNNAVNLTGYEATVDTDMIATRVENILRHLVDDTCTVTMQQDTTAFPTFTS